MNRKNGSPITLSIPKTTHQIIKNYCVKNGLIFTFAVEKFFSDLFSIEPYPAPSDFSTDLNFDINIIFKKLSNADREKEEYKKCLLYLPHEIHINIKIYCVRHKLAMRDFLTNLAEIRYIKNKNVDFIFKLLCNSLIDRN